MKYTDPSEFFKYIIEKSDINIINDTQKCLSMALDLLDSEKPYFKLLKLAINNNVYKGLINGYNSDSNTRIILINKAIKILKDDCFINDEKAVWAVGWLAYNIYPNEWVSFKEKLNIITEYKNENLNREPSVPISEIKNKNNTLEKSWTLEPLNLEMILCPAGEFIMGSPENELGRNPDEIQHKVILSKDFYIGKYLITQIQYGMLTGLNPSKFKGDNNPVTNLSLNDINSFCDKLNSKYSSLIPQGYRFDLPTEAQWEYACRAGTNTALNNGKNLTSIEGFCSNLDEVAWYNLNSNNMTHPVGQKKPNAWGIYDMLGNVWERCKDRYGEYPQNPVIDPFVGNGGSFIISIFGETIGSVFANYIIRGGSFSQCKYLTDFRSRSAVRDTAEAAGKGENIGFRVALVPVA